MIQRQSTSPNRLHECEMHHKKCTHICTSPQCGNFKELCEECLLEDQEHSHDHKDKQTAFLEVQNQIETVFKGLKALRKKILHTMDSKMSSQNGLKEIEEKLEQIKQNLNSKIDHFHLQLKRIYHKNIREKLNQLFFIVEKSYQFLQQQKIRLYKYKKLKPFYLNDLGHDLKHYQSYYQEVLQKNVRKFKAGFEQDKVLEMMVGFQQNLAQIFAFEAPFEITYEPHLIIVNSKANCLYRFHNGALSNEQIQSMSRSLHQNLQMGTLPSTYFSPTQNYYIFGQFGKQSNRISRIQLNSKQFRSLQIKLSTKRMNFAVCLFQKEIFIVGGENEKEGCLIKCQKFVPQQGKTYIVNSLNQRSSQHTLCNYKDKFMLKIGGTDIVKSLRNKIKLTHHYHMNPEIYFGQTQDWKIVELDYHNLTKKLSFGLWPTILIPQNSQQQVIILSGTGTHKMDYKQRYDMSLQIIGKQLKQVKIVKYLTNIPQKMRVFSQLSFYNERNNSFMLTYMNSIKEHLNLRQFVI